MQKFIISRDDAIYEAWPDVALTQSGKLVCVFAQCTHHSNRDYTQIMLCESSDRGRNWSPKRALTEPLHRQNPDDRYWNCPRITALRDGRLIVVIDRVAGGEEGNFGGEQSNWLFISDDEGANWSGPTATPVEGIVPDQLQELQSGRWLLGAHGVTKENGATIWKQRYWHSDDAGQSWQGPHIAAAVPDLRLCEGSVLELPTGELVCFMRENLGTGLDCHKTISRDAGETWSEPICFPLPACHRPVAGMLASGKVLITHRFAQGGNGWWAQNFFAGLTDVESCLAPSREEAHTRILPLDFDRSAHSDTGYSGWVQFEDGEIYVVNYIVDDAPKGQIRGYSLRESDFLL